MRDRIVLYGSLKRGYPSFAALRLHQKLRYLGPCRLPGALYDLGAYPAYVPGPGSVFGDLFAIVDPEIVPLLDAFEDFDPRNPAGSEYVREWVRLTTPAAFAAIYRYNQPIGSAPRIAGGRWTKRLRARD